MPRPKAPPRVNGPYPDRDGTRFRVRIFHHDLQRQDLYFHTEKEALAAIAQQIAHHSVGGCNLRRHPVQDAVRLEIHRVTFNGPVPFVCGLKDVTVAHHRRAQVCRTAA